ELACWDRPGMIPFYPVVYSIPWDRAPERNIGASSCFRDAGNYGERLIQREIQVRAVRLDEFMDCQGIPSADLICMDVQGGALNVRKGLGSRLRQTRWVLTELETLLMYHGEALIGEVEAYLEGYQFERCAEKIVNDYFGDFLYKNLSIDP